MIGRIAGRLDWKGMDQVLIDCRGVGYIVHVNERTLVSLPPVGEAVALYTDLQVREDLLQLFGFPSMLEREWHRLLTTVQGVGAKASMAILGALGAEGVSRAITLEDARAIRAAPGIGPKLAQRLILELKSKAPALMAMGPGLTTSNAQDVIDAESPVIPRPVAASPAFTRASSTADALSALLNLGYGQGDAAEAVARAGGENPDADTPALIRLALKHLAPQ